MKKLLLLMTGVILTGATEENSSQFNLVCTGTMRESGTSVEQPWSRIYRVDIEEKYYCEDGCSEVKLLQVDPNEIKFSNLSSVDRSSGRLSAVESQFDLTAARRRTLAPAYVVEANCVRKPFSGIPRKF